MSVFPDSIIAAVIFDLDGVLVDTEPLHLSATRELIAPNDLSTEQYEQFIGRGGFREWIETTYGIERSQIDARYNDLFYAELNRHTLEPLAGSRELIDAIRDRGIGLAVASQSSPLWVEATLRQAGLRDEFPVVVTASEAGRDKPEPDVYLYAASVLGVAPDICIAVEDSVYGVASAAAAGMWVVQSTQASFSPEAQPGAHAIVTSLQDFDLAWLDGEPPN